MTTQTYTPIELTAILKIGIHSILRLIARGDLEAFNVSRSRDNPRWRISQDALERFVASRTTRPKSEPTARRKRKAMAGMIEFF